jgi:hypothetical protein
LEDEQYTYWKEDIGNPLCVKLMTGPPDTTHHNNGDGPMSCFSWRPSLKRIEIQKLRMPYELWDDEYTIQLQINKLGMYSVIPTGYNGFCKHIGIGYHVADAAPCKTANKIYTRRDFVDKINIRLNDI